MTIARSIYHRLQRFRTLQTDHIHSLPIVILMPHSACNCRCVMCDIWKANDHKKQLSEKDVEGLLASLRRFGTQQVLMSGGEALLHPNFFRLCSLLNKENIRITLLSTGITLAKHASSIAEQVHDVILSLDGDEATHDRIRNIPGAFQKLRSGVEAIRSIDPGYRITSRTVIHRLNYQQWPAIIETARALGLNQASFFPADITSQAFNREQAWDETRQKDILVPLDELPSLKLVVEGIISRNKQDFSNGFIAESPERLFNIYNYYAAHHGLNPFPYKKCNAPWVSTVIEADGTVRPCFFHQGIGNIHDQGLDQILNSDRAKSFRKELNMDTDSTCKQCVCYLNLSPSTDLNK